MPSASNGMLGYVGKKADGSYEPFHWKISLPSQDVDISDDVFLIQRELAEAYEAGKISLKPEVVVDPDPTITPPKIDGKSRIPASIPRLVWSGEDELLHEGALEVRRNRRLEAHASSGDCPR
jgi:hypothetical protein